MTNISGSIDTSDGMITIPAMESLSVGGVLLVVSLMIMIGLKRYARGKNHNNPARIFIHRLLPPLFILLLAIAANSSLSVQSNILEEPWNERVKHGFTIITIAAIGWLIHRLLVSVRVFILRRYTQGKHKDIHARQLHTQIEVVGKVLSFLVIVMTLAGILLTFDGAAVIGESLFASAGVAGIILGFAAQKTIGNLFAGIQIAIAQPIRVEDVVIIEQEWGWIEEINLTYVIVRIWDLRRLVVPITHFTEKPFQNWTRNDPEIIGSVIIYCDYNVPIEEMRDALTAILKQTDLWNGNVNILQVTDTRETTIEVRALMTGNDAPTTWDLRCHVREKLVNWIRTHYSDALPRTRMHMEYSQIDTSKVEEF